MARANIAEQPIVYVRLDPEMKAQVVAAAKAADRPVSSWLRTLIRDHFSREAGQ